MITYKNISISFANQPILDRLNFRVSRGEKIIIMGSSGSGKSTMLKIGAGVEKPDSGSIFINENELTKRNIHKIRQEICYIPQHISPYEKDTVTEFIETPFHYHANRYLKNTQKDLDMLLDSFQLSKKICKKNLMQLSGGERQRVALIRGLLLKRNIYYFDEVSSAVDPAIEKDMLSVIDSLDATVLAISHSDAWKNIASRVITLQNGAIKEE